MATPAEHLTRPPTLPVLRRGAKSNTVKYAQELLNLALGWHPPLQTIVGADGSFGGTTQDAVSLLQYRFSLPITGIIDPATWTLLERFHPVTRLGPVGSPGPVCVTPPINPLILVAAGLHLDEPQQTLPEIARPYVGARETGNNRMGTDPRMREIFEADDLTVGGATDGYPWCAAFVSLCVQQLIARFTIRYTGVTPPREASVSRFLNTWAKHQKCLIFKPSSKIIAPQSGDIVVYTFSHIGIVDTAGDRAVTTIEGNTDAAGGREGVEVAEKRRSFSVIRAFIRLPVWRLCI